MTATLKATKSTGLLTRGREMEKIIGTSRDQRNQQLAHFVGEIILFNASSVMGGVTWLEIAHHRKTTGGGRATITNLLPPEEDRKSKRESNENEKSIPKSDSKPQSTRDSIKTGAASNKTREQYYNPDPLARLIGKSNESTIIIDGKQYTALIDSGAQVTTITIDLVAKLKLPIYGLQTLLNFRGTGGGNIPYHGYIGVTMEIPEIKGFKEDVLMSGHR